MGGHGPLTQLTALPTWDFGNGEHWAKWDDLGQINTKQGDLGGRNPLSCCTPSNYSPTASLLLDPASGSGVLFPSPSFSSYEGKIKPGVTSVLLRRDMDAGPLGPS